MTLVFRSVFGLSALLLLGALSPAAADAPELSLPVDCEINATCFTQQYVDVDQGPGARDHTCGAATYDGHKGTDFRVVTLEDVKRGVAVLAAAGGVVKSLRDGEPDRLVRSENDQRAIKGRECGNGVLIVHEDGWETQYCHLREGSLSVAAGQEVAPGDKLGLIGYSGNAAFPHVHFELRHNGQVIDPFTGQSSATACGATKAEGLWKPDVADALTYDTAQVLDLGFASGPVKLADLVAGRTKPFEPVQGLPAMVVYVWAINLLLGDQISLRLEGPDGAIVQHDAPPLVRNRAQQMIFAGKKVPDLGWPKGQYVGQVEIVRRGRVVRRLERRFELE